MGDVSRIRVVIGTAGVLLLGFGAYRLLTEIPGDDLLVVALWLVGAVALHDGLLAPVTVAIGALIARVVPRRARRYLQGALIAGALVTVVALPMIHRAFSQPDAKGVLEQNYAGNLTLLLTLIAGTAVLLYVSRVIRDRQAASSVNDRPSDDHDSADE